MQLHRTGAGHFCQDGGVDLDGSRKGDYHLVRSEVVTLGVALAWSVNKTRQYRSWVAQTPYAVYSWTVTRKEYGLLVDMKYTVYSNQRRPIDNLEWMRTVLGDGLVYGSWEGAPRVYRDENYVLRLELQTLHYPDPEE